MEKWINNKGQSTLEFIMTFTTAVGFIFLFLKMAMNYTDGFMVHHATYMAGRAYMVSDENRDSLEEGDSLAMKKAREVFTSYLPEGLVKDVTATMLQENNPGVVKFQAFIGVYIKYEEKFSLGFLGGKFPIRMTSEAFLGREPTRRESRTQVCNAIMDLGLGSCSVHVTLEDNGG
ncbi:MAG: hypothetical protein H7177_18155 [Rhizobacter sp.]|nr:hypothetical protein [Bacteriovorax sp.]